MTSTHVILAFIVAILVALGSGMVFLVRDQGSRRRTVTALSLRIGLSIALILFLVIGYRMGWIHPHGLAGP
jgi:hypothetical protein